jgi:exonuclease SbcC
LKPLQKEKEKMELIRQQKLENEKLLSDILGKISLKKQEERQLKNEIEKLENQLKESGKVGAKCPTCGQEIGKLEKDHVSKELSNQIITLQNNLSKIDYNPEDKEKIKLDGILKELIFDSEKYSIISRELQDLEQLQGQKEKEVSLKATLETEKKVVVEMRTLFQNKKAQVEKLEEEVKKIPDISDQLFKAGRGINETEQQLVDIRDEEKQARGTLGQINELISRTAQLEKTLISQNDKKSSLHKEKEAFEELALAFGKKGIQTMIIETAIPEIEDETNRLLDKLTEGRMRVSLITQKETKAKIAKTGERGIVETLDINISDEMGERPYESFSGGEAFRVNFAIRLALSKLLTHRAGAKLQFLVIDEGFGTQDAQGRSRIVEALDAIKNDFEKILVITHLEELKDEFPVRIEVSKGSTGSTFEIVGV